MKKNVFNALQQKSTDELQRLLNQEKENFSKDAIETIKDILKSRGIYIDKEESTRIYRRTEGDQIIEKLARSSKRYILVGIILIILAFLVIMPEFDYHFRPNIGTLFLTILKSSLGLWLLVKGLKQKRKLKQLLRTKSKIILSGNEDWLLSRKLFEAIVSYKKEHNPIELQNIISQLINVSNFEKINKDFEAEYYQSFINSILDISSSYADLKKLLKPLIDIGVIEPTYPHAQIRRSV